MACPPLAPWTTITVITLLLYADPVPSNSCLSGISLSKRPICIFACLTFNMGGGGGRLKAIQFIVETFLMTF